MKIIYMGSSNFSLFPLKALISSQHKVVGVFTSCKNGANPVALLAQENKISVYTPKTFKTEQAINQLHNIQADIIVVASYGLILPKSVLESKQHGCINIHPSALPQFRGASPIQHTILSGITKSAVCIMQMNEGVDTGEILMKESFVVQQHIYYEQLEHHCSLLGATLLLKTLSNLDGIKPQPQSDKNISYTSKIQKSDGRIIWQQHIAKTYNQIRAFHLWPGSYFFYQDQYIKILKATFELLDHNIDPGRVIDDKLSIACKAGILYPLVVQRSGKKPLCTPTFLRGFRITKGTIVS